MTPVRYGIYYVPPAEAEWARFGTRWLGWDIQTGQSVPHPTLDLPISDITQTPRRYGLHGTVKPPFRLADGYGEDDLRAACVDLAGDLSPVVLDGLALARLGRFLALRPLGDENALPGLAARVVETLDPFRAPTSAEDLERRRKMGLTAAQDANLERWGYPYVMDCFRFHITLTGRLDQSTLAATEAELNKKLIPLLPRPVVIGDLALVAEDEDSRFHLLHRYTLSG